MQPVPVIMPPPPNGLCSFRLPYIEDDSQTPVPRSYWQMLRLYFSLYFSFRTWSFFFIVVTLILLIVPQFLFMPLNKTMKLFSYTHIPWVYMNPIETKFINHWTIYKCFTTLFFHLNYTHWLGNLLGITVNLFTIEFCWCPSILFAMIGGTATSAYAALIMNPMLMGFSGVIACSVGMYFAMFLSNLTFLRNHYPHKIIVWAINCVLIFILLFNQDARSTMVHFIAFFIGLVYGYAWMPKFQQEGCERIISVVCKFVSIIITILPFVLIFLHPTTGIHSQFSRGMFGSNNSPPNVFNPHLNPQFNLQFSPQFNQQFIMHPHNQLNIQPNLSPAPNLMTNQPHFQPFSPLSPHQQFHPFPQFPQFEPFQPAEQTLQPA